MLRAASLEADRARRGLWKLDHSSGFKLRAISDVEANGQLIMPKLYRRMIEYGSDLTSVFKGSLLEWFKANPSRDDGVTVAGVHRRLSHYLRVSGWLVMFGIASHDIVFNAR